MRSTRIGRVVAILACLGLVAGAFLATPAEAKKRKKKKKKPAACAAYQPGEFGAEAPVTLVTDAATAEAPVEVALETAPGLGASSEEGEGNPDELGSTHSYTNVQVDSKASSADLNVKLVFPQQWDYDLWVRDSSHAVISSSAGFGPLVGGGSEGQTSDFGSEQTPPITTTDCDGYTVDVVSATSTGGEVTVQYWLGSGE
jgi:hypothetical protein